MQTVNQTRGPKVVNVFNWFQGNCFVRGGRLWLKCDKNQTDDGMMEVASLYSRLALAKVQLSMTDVSSRTTAKVITTPFGVAGTWCIQSPNHPSFYFPSREKNTGFFFTGWRRQITLLREHSSCQARKLWMSCLDSLICNFLDSPFHCLFVFSKHVLCSNIDVE